MTQPIGFERNDEQTASDVRYFSRGSSATLFLTDREALLSFHGGSLEMTLKGGSPAARIEAFDPAPGAVNYFIGEEPSQWRRSIPRFQRVRYSSVYPGIDLVYYGIDRNLEYDFVVAPGADPSAIWMAFGSADSLQIDPSGDLVIRVADQRNPTA